DFDDRDSETGRQVVGDRLERLFRTKTRDEWCSLLEGSDACFAPVLGLDEAPRHPHLAARATFAQFNGVVQPAPAARFSHPPSAIQAVPPQTDLGRVARAWQQPSRL